MKRAVALALLVACGHGGSGTAPDAATPPPDAAPPGACPAPFATSPTGAADVAPPEPATPIASAFTVTIDRTAPALDSPQREPQAAPLTIARTSGDLRIVGGVKRFALHADRLWVELYVVADGADGVAGATAALGALTGASAVRDVSIDPLAAPTDARTFALGGIAPAGVARLRLGLDLPAGTAPVTFTLAIAGTVTHRVATSSAPIAITPDGAQVWAPFADGGTVAVLDAATRARLASIAVPGRPGDVAITPDGALALVTSRDCNQLSVVEVASRAVVQVFGEAEGLGRDPRHVVLSPDGTRAYVSSYVGDRVTALERVGGAFRIAKSLDVGRRPTGLSVTPDGKTLYVAHFLPRGPIRDNEAWLSAIDTAAMTALPDVVMRDDADETEAACLNKTGAFAGYGGDRLTFEAVPTQLSGVFLAPGGATAWVPALRVAGFPIFEGDPSALGFQFLAVGANSPAMLFPLDTRAPQAAGFRKTPAIIDITDRTEDFLACVPATDDAEAVRTRPGANPDETIYAGVTIPSQGTFLDETGVARFIGYTRGGRRGLVLSYVADELAVFDPATHSPTTRGHFLLSGSNPIGLVVSPDGARAYVAYENSPFVSVLDLAAYNAAALPEPMIVPYRLDPGAAAGQGAAIITFLMLTRSLAGVPAVPPVTELGQIALGADPMDPVMRRGKVLFTSSSPVKYPTLSGTRQAACAACHPDGGADGSAWSTMEGERRTIALWGGVAGRGWLHASGTHRSITDFATTIVTERLGGTGLSAADEAALSTYAARGIPELQRPAVDATAAARGQVIFAARCTNCHQDVRGDGRVDATSPYGGGDVAGPTLWNVDTSTDWAGVTLSEAYTHLFPPVARKVLDTLRGDRALGPDDYVEQTLKFTGRPARPRGRLKVPPLVDVYDHATYFHDARFTSLEEVVDYFDAQLALALSAGERADLLAYLRTL